MQKKIIALAVAGLASSAAFAQTNVVVYGVADGSFDYVWQSDSKLNQLTNTTVVTTNAAGVVTGVGTVDTLTTQGNDVSTTRVSTNSSYLGFKGSEDLGNGLKAIFQIESGINFDNATGTWANRDSFVGISHANAGTIVFGNLTGPTRALGAALDVNPGATGIGANSGLIGKIAGSTLKSSVVVIPTATTINGVVTAAGNVTTNLGYGTNAGCGASGTCTSIFDTRWKNTVAYLSPNWGGFSFAGAYTQYLENKTPDYGAAYTFTSVNGAVPTLTATTGATLTQNFAQGDTYGYDIGAKWEGMGFMVGLTYNWAQLGDWLGTEVDNLRFGAMYTAPNWSVRGLWEKTSADFSNNLLAGNTDQQKFGLGGTFSIGKTTLLAQWYGTNSAKDISNSKANLYEVGALYNLSKRTMLKATWAMIDNDEGSAADFGINAIGNQNLTASAGVQRVPAVGDPSVTTTASSITQSGFGAKNQGIQIGVRHSF
jgi:predicted porin